MVKKILRRTLRTVLFVLARAALKKHHPTVVAIVGEGKTEIVREAIYTAIKEALPARRNLEAPNAEFVLPLTILGARNYPLSIPRWLSFLLRSALQLLLLPAHQNVLILEIGATRREVFDYFWNITRPAILVRCGKAPFLSPHQTAPKTFLVRETRDLSGYLETAVRVAEALKVKRRDAREALKKLELPKARINILPSRNGGIIVDATYHYYPPNPKALEEVLEALPGKKIFLTAGQEIPEDLKIKKGEVAVLTGSNRELWTLIARLTRTSWAP